MQIRHSLAAVPDFTFPVILGSDFLRCVNAVINYSNVITVTFCGEYSVSIVGVFAEKMVLQLPLT